MENRGIINRGGNMIIKGPINIDSTINNSININEDSSDIIRELEKYSELLKANKDSLDNVNELLDSIFTIKEELKKEPPNRITIKGVINELAASVSSITSLATALEALRMKIL
jgi:translation initiation factor 2B subunit (eIF-2B alpha/beta/delta family)